MVTIPSANVIASLEKLRQDSKLTKHAHSLAGEKKKMVRYMLGISATILGMFASTGIVELVTLKQAATVIVKLLTFLSGGLAGTLTFLNYGKDVEVHSGAIGVYANICRDAEFLIDEAKDGIIDPGKLAAESKKLIDRYEKANIDYQNCIPTNKDFERAKSDGQKEAS